MEYNYSKSFIKDTKKIPNEIRRQVAELVESVRAVEHFGQIANVKKLKSFSNAYRIRIGDYRVGIFLEDEAVIFTRLLHRKEIYKYFP